LTRKGLAAGAFLAVALMAGAAASLPGDLRLPVHWGLGGVADRYAGKWEALLTPPAIALGLSALFYFLPSLEPRERNLSRSQGLYLWAWAASLMLMAAIEAVTISIALGRHWRTYHVITAAVGLMFVMIGNQLGKSRSMYLIGIRTPWTLASEEVWIRTHRLAGKLMVLGGLLLALSALLPIPSGLLATVFAGGIALMVGVPVVYSYLLWRRERGEPSTK
jgi:uncharacterized membrane protein